MADRIVFHVGTPKTGTTAFQNYMNDRRREHGDLGVFYPETPEGRALHKPLTKSLLRGLPDLSKIIRKAISAAPSKTNTILFSHEGIYSAWPIFPLEHREILRTLSKKYPIEVWITFREPLSFMISLYGELVHHHASNRDSIGDRSLDEMLTDAEFLKNFEYCKFVEEISTLVGPENVKIQAYSVHAIADMLERLGLPFDGVEQVRNVSLSGHAIRQMRYLHSMDLSGEAYQAARRAIMLTDDPKLPRFEPSEYARVVASKLAERHGVLKTFEGRPLGSCWSEEQARGTSKMITRMETFAERKGALAVSPDQKSDGVDFFDGNLKPSDKLIVAFTGIKSAMGGVGFEFYKSLVGFSVLFVRDNKKQWYRRDAQRTVENIRLAIKKTGATRLYCIGNSMGGFAALLFGSLCQANGVIAFSPQTVMDPDITLSLGDERWVKYQANSEGLPYADLNDLAPARHATLVYGGKDFYDMQHAERLIWPCELVKLESSSHNVAKILKDNGELFNFINERFI